MTPTNTLLDAIVTRIAADAGTLAHATDGCLLHLAKNNFTPSPTTVLADLEEADFDGYAPLEAGPTAQQWFVDPVSTERVVQMLEPAGGWHWETTGMTNLPQDVTGYYLTDNAGTVLFATARLATNVTLTGANQGVDIGNVRFTVSSSGIG